MQITNQKPSFQGAKFSNEVKEGIVPLTGQFLKQIVKKTLRKQKQFLSLNFYREDLILLIKKVKNYSLILPKTLNYMQKLTGFAGKMICLR